MNAKRKILSLLVVAALFAPILAFMPNNAVAQADATVVIDYSHGNTRSSIRDSVDVWLDGNLTALGYTVIWAKGGINATLLADADALILGSTFGEGYSTAEVTAISDWYGAGKFLWVATDSDYDGPGINHNASLVIEAVGGHIYGEEGDIKDLESNAGGDYRPVANETTDAAHLAGIVTGVTDVLCHGPTSIIGSNDGTFAGATVDLTTTSIANVYPVLFYSAAATIADNDVTPGKVYDVGDQGSFVAMAIEYLSGGILAVSGASPYGDYQPMYTEEYYGTALNGDVLVENMLAWGLAPTAQPMMIDPLLIVAIVGVVAVVIIIIVVMKRK